MPEVVIATVAKVYLLTHNGAQLNPFLPGRTRGPALVRHRPAAAAEGCSPLGQNLGQCLVADYMKATVLRASQLWWAASWWAASWWAASWWAASWRAASWWAASWRAASWR
jgi:hypothetical protein